MKSSVLSAVVSPLIVASADIPPAFLIFGGVILVLLIWFVTTYNGFKRLLNYIRESWSNVDTELKRRYDLIPNLVNAVKGYMKHEEGVLERVVELRNRAASNRGSVKSQADDEQDFVRALSEVFVVVENYPDLKASNNFLHLQKELVNTEDRIQAARRFYNANVRDMNNRVQSIPSNLIAAMFNFREADYFEVDSVARSVPSTSMQD